MSAAAIAVLMGLAIHAAVSTALSGPLVWWWRRSGRDHPAAVLLMARLLPTVAAAAAVVVLLPAFIRHEPNGPEAVGPAILGLAALGSALIATAAWRAARALGLTMRLLSSWRTKASAVEVGPELAAEVVDVPYPLVAVVGILRPRIVIARSVAAHCSADDLRRMAAHEHAHIRARDNLKRLLLDCCPDVLRLTGTGRAMVAAWDAAAEDAADDQAAGTDPSERVALAEVLIKMARLSAGQAGGPELASTLVGIGNVERRVRRLLTGDGPATAVSRASWIPAGLLILTTTAIVVTVFPVARTIHSGLELLVTWGR